MLTYWVIHSVNQSAQLQVPLVSPQDLFIWAGIECRVPGDSPHDSFSPASSWMTCICLRSLIICSLCLSWECPHGPVVSRLGCRLPSQAALGGTAGRQSRYLVAGLPWPSSGGAVKSPGSPAVSCSTHCRRWALLPRGFSPTFFNPVFKLEPRNLFFLSGVHLS